jgi:hypothetical protein
MFTPEEKPLLTGDDEAIAEFVDCDRCLVIDWRGTEDEAIDDAVRFLPEGALTYETSFPGNETIAIRLRYHGREDSFSLPFQPQNNFRALLRVWRLLQPDYDMMIFRCTADSDTQALLLRPKDWWSAYRAAHPQQYQRIFRDVTDLTEMWDLGTPPSTSSASESGGPKENDKPWWKFWKP